MIVTAIAAMSKNHVIGKGNYLPWHLPAELNFFKETTSGHAVIMGRNTFKSIHDRIGKPLPNRTNIIVSNSMKTAPEGFLLADSLPKAIKLANQTESIEVFIIGGASIYSNGLTNNLIDKIYLTVIDSNIDGDTYFPELAEKEWQIKPLRAYKSDNKNQYDFTIYEYNRK